MSRKPITGPEGVERTPLSVPSSGPSFPRLDTSSPLHAEVARAAHELSNSSKCDLCPARTVGPARMVAGFALNACDSCMSEVA